MLHSLLLTWFGWVRDGGYWGIIALMAMESSIFPVPSEVVMPPAAYWAAQGKLNFWGVVAAGTFGSWLGSAITYAVARWAGRPFLERYGRYFLMPPAKVARAEAMMARYQWAGLFFSRLLPVIRHLISIPAGIMRLSFAQFSAITVVGAGLWCWILCAVSLKITQRNPGLLDDPEALIKAVKHDCLWIILAVLALGGSYFLMLRLTSKKDQRSYPHPQ
jgi:membrane protein DedA with SNARE-associated domain